MTSTSAARELTRVDRSPLDTSPPRRRLRACESVQVMPPTSPPASWLEGRCTARALVLWPRLDRRRLRRCHDDPERIAVLVADRTALPYEAIVKLLVEEETAESELAVHWTLSADDWRLRDSEPEIISGHQVVARPLGGAAVRHDRPARPYAAGECGRDSSHSDHSSSSRQPGNTLTYYRQR